VENRGFFSLKSDRHSNHIKELVLDLTVSLVVHHVKERSGFGRYLEALESKVDLASVAGEHSLLQEEVTHLLDG
jgi:hypothetical protein